MEEIRDSLSGQAGLLAQLLTAAMEPDLAKTGLTLSGFELLSAVYAGGGKAAQADIAKRLGISAPSLSEAVRGSVKKGFLTQSPIPGDARVKRLKLTPKGRTAVRNVMEAVHRSEAEMIVGIESKRVEEAIDVLRTVNRNLSRSLITEK